MRIARVFLGLAALSDASLALAAPTPPPELPVSTFFQKPNVAQLTFSPDGKRIACLVPFERRMNLAVVDLEKKTKNLLTNFKDNDVGSLLWAGNDNRTLFVSSSVGRATAAVFRYDTKTRTLGDLVYGDPIYDVGGVVWDEAKNKVVAITRPHCSGVTMGVLTRV